jgi:hypothetical protein
MRLFSALLMFSVLACHHDSTEAPLQQPTMEATTRPLPKAPEGALVWKKRATLPKKHPQACDLESVDGKLFVAASTDALGSNGAGLYELLSNNTIEKRFDWSGQGFLRVHQAGDRLLVPDADAPFGLGFFVRLDVDGFVFAFDPSDTNKYTKEVIPSVYHVFDTATLDGRVYASTGAYAEGETPYRNERNPAALFVQEGAGKPWKRAVEFPKVPDGTETGVVRFTFLQALEGGKMLAALTDWSNATGGDGAVLIEGLPDKPTVARVKGLSGNTLRWERFGDKIYHIGEVGGLTQVSVSTDGGASFSPLMNAPAGPQSLVASERALFLLADGIIYRSEDGLRFTAVTPKNDALAYQWMPLTSASLEIHQGELWAASPVHGELWSASPQ